MASVGISCCRHRRVATSMRTGSALVARFLQHQDRMGLGEAPALHDAGELDGAANVVGGEGMVRLSASSEQRSGQRNQ